MSEKYKCKSTNDCLLLQIQEVKMHCRFQAAIYLLFLVRLVLVDRVGNMFPQGRQVLPNLMAYYGWQVPIANGSFEDYLLKKKNIKNVLKKEGLWENMIILSCFFPFPFSLQTRSNSVFSGKAAISLRNGHHAESWKSSKQQSLQERSEKIKVILTTKTFRS